MDILENIWSAILDTPALSLIIVNSMALLVIIGVVVVYKGRRNKPLIALFGLLVFINIILALPLAIDMFLK